ncbi:hypothetical protein B484DRAFT_222530 [Ochromonadaceae sp. CCMP2298]|nr:hypothetical protein B484DRAFT_222530 [Ochromonadaceae sp. CCMP2298]
MVDLIRSTAASQEPTDALPKCVATGDTLLGSASLLKKGEAYGKIPLTYSVNVLSAPAAPTPASTPTPTPAPAAAPTPTPETPATAAPATVEDSTDVSSAPTEASAPVPAPVPAPTVPAPGPAAAPEDVDALLEPLATALRDAKLKVLEGLVGSTKTTATTAKEGGASVARASAFDVHFASMAAEYPAHLPVFMAQLQHRTALAKSARSAGGAGAEGAVALLEGVVAAAAQVEAQIDAKGVAVELGQLADKENTAVQKRRKEAEAQRDSLVKAFAAKCQALADLRDIQAHGGAGGTCAGAEADADPAVASLWGGFEAAYAELQKWESSSSTADKWCLYVYNKKHQGKYGAALQRVTDVLAAAPATGKKAKEGPGPSREQLLAEQAVLLGLLGWPHLLARVRSAVFLNAVNKFQPM